MEDLKHLTECEDHDMDAARLLDKIKQDIRADWAAGIPPTSTLDQLYALLTHRQEGEPRISNPAYWDSPAPSTVAPDPSLGW
jgi:hypothetical protein